MRYVRRDENGKLNGHFANEQSYATELLPDDHPDIVGWEDEKKDYLAKPKRLERAEARIADLVSRVEALEARGKRP